MELTRWRRILGIAVPASRHLKRRQLDLATPLEPNCRVAGIGAFLLGPLHMAYPSRYYPGILTAGCGPAEFSERPVSDFPHFEYSMRDVRRAGDALRGDLIWTDETAEQIREVFKNRQ